MKKWNSKNGDGYFIDYNDLKEPCMITVIHNQNVYDISSHEPRFKSVLSLIKKKQFTKLPKYISNEGIFSDVANKNEIFELRDRVLFIENEPVPDMLGTEIIKRYHNQKDLVPLLKFWDSLKKNTDKQTVEDLYSFLKNDGHHILDDGSFVAYRTVDYDFKDIWTKSVKNEIGSTITLDKAKVDANKNNSAGFGLHVATIQKAINFGGWNVGSTKVRLLAVKVFPEDVVVGIDPHNPYAYLRTCRYTILQEITDGNVLLDD
jgi:hypothetical protein